MSKLERRIRKLHKKWRANRRRHDFMSWYRNCGERPVVVQVSSAIQDDGSFVNYGDHTMVTPVEKELDRRGYSHKRLAREVIELGALEQKSHGLFLDSSGFMYSNAHVDRRSINAVAATLHNVTLFRRAGFKAVLAPQSLGPFAGELREAMTSLLPHFDLVFARDANSKHYVEELAAIPDSRVRVVQDTAFVFDIASKELGVRLLRDRGIEVGVPERPVVGINLNRQVASRVPDYLDVVGLLIEHLKARHRQVVLLPHERGRGGRSEIDDQALTADLASRYGVSALLREGCDVVQSEKDYIEAVESAISSLDFLVAGRFHVAVRGLSEFVPTMCNSWSHKYETLFERVGLAKELIFSPDETRVDSIDALVWKFEAAWSRRQNISAALRKELPALKREVGRFFDEALATTS